MNSPGIGDDVEAAADAIEKRGLGKYVAIASIVAGLAGAGTIYQQWDELVMMLAKDKIDLAVNAERDRVEGEATARRKELWAKLSDYKDQNTRLKIYCKMVPACRKNFNVAFWVEVDDESDD